MTSWRLARRGIGFYLRSHLGTIVGAAIATAVLTGALLVGDSVRESLRQMALARLGQIDHALASGDRLFRAQLAPEVSKNSPGQPFVAAVLQLPGTAGNPETSARANRVQINGVEADFWKLGNQPSQGVLSNNTVWINQRLSRQLGARAGDTILLRVPRVSNLSRDAPLSPEEDTTVAMRLTVGRILSDQQMGNFGLQASQTPPFNAFVPLEQLQQRVQAAGRANLLVADAAANSEAPLKIPLTMEDAQLQLLQHTNINRVEFRTSRVFLDAPVAESIAKLGAAPGRGRAEPIFTYFVNELRLGDKATPYSMVTAATSPLVPEGMREDEIVINQWLADDLQAKAGDELALTYYIMGTMRELVQRTNTFKVRAVVPMELPYADPALMPDFPGMSDAENCRDWDTGFPINTEAIRDKDEAYWDQYRGAPKAFITLVAGQQLWANRFGNLTAVRFATADGATLSHLAGTLRAALNDRLDPRAIGFVFEPVRSQALAASKGAQDFGGLFIGFSFFLIAAALLLMAMLFRFALEQRGMEIGTLLAIGFPPARVKRLLLFEGAGLAIIGGVLGVFGGMFYARGMVHGLSTIWREAIGDSTVAYHGAPGTLATGLALGVLVAIGTMWWTLRQEGKRPARELLAGGMSSSSAIKGNTSKRNFWLGAASLAAALALAGWALAQGTARADLFFAAGGLVLLCGLFWSAAGIQRLEHSSAAEGLSLLGMGIRAVTRRASRSRATIVLLACGAFLIASIGAFRLETGDTQKRGSGTGGFTLIGESSIAIVHNLNAESGRDFYNLSSREIDGVSFVPLRVLEGDDASCLNLNRAQRPRVLGVNQALLAERNAFTFNKTARESSASPWLLLDQDFGENVVPAIGDAASVKYAMGKKVGESLRYLDQAGKEFEVKIVGAVANSILQGNLLIAEKHFIRRFPGEAGYRMFLIDAPSNRAQEISAMLSRALEDAGLEVTLARDRLAAFNAVQNTYIGTFQLLGGLGLLLGSAGLGIVLLRNVLERRPELALLLAVGFRRPALRWLVLSEHAALLAAGLLVGVSAAVIAVLPELLKPGTELPYAQLGLTLLGVIACGLVCTAVAAGMALRAPLLKSLRQE